ncbi:MAG: hypothetical protein HOV94_03040 [Saccharothrix sp.]|nr:hypothetical protein [Saccharothrix sp.]
MAALHDEGSYLAALAAVESLLAKAVREQPAPADDVPPAGREHGGPADPEAS